MYLFLYGVFIPFSSWDFSRREIDFISEPIATAALRIDSYVVVNLVSRSVISTSRPGTPDFTLFLAAAFIRAKDWSEWVLPKKGLFLPLRDSLIASLTPSVCFHPKPAMHIFSILSAVWM